MLEFRAYINEGGKVMLAGDAAGQQYTTNVGRAALRPAGRRSTATRQPADVDPRRCLPTYGSFFGGDTTNDVLQYYLGGYLAVANDGHERRRRRSTRSASTTRSRVCPGASTTRTSPATRCGRSSFIATSGILPVDEFPQFDSWPSAR